MIIGGGFLCFFGYKEYSVSAGTSSEPLNVELLDIENGKAPDNNYIRLGPHYRLYAACVYQYEVKNDSEQPTDRTKVNWVYYPVYSTGGPFGQQMDVLTKKYGGFDNFPDELPENELLPSDNLSMIIKTKEYRSIGAVPEGMLRCKNIEGLVVNSIEPLGFKEEKLLASGFGEIDFSRVLILQQGRTPTSTAVSFAMMGGGALLIAAPLLVGLFMGRSKPKARVTPTPQVDNAPAAPLDAMAAPTPPAPTDADDNPYRRTD
jgi:hypothetical protein